MLFDSQVADLIISAEDNLVNKIANLDLNKYTFIPEIKPKRSYESQFRDNVTEVLPDGRREIRSDIEYTTAERSLGAALSQIDTAENVSKMTGASISSIRNWKRGVTDATNGIENAVRRPELVNATKQKLNEIRDVAMEKLLMTLGVIKDTDVNLLGAKDASIVASNLSRVVEKTMPKEDLGTQRPQIIMYSPTQMNVESFQVIES